MMGAIAVVLLPIQAAQSQSGGMSPVDKKS